MSLVRAEGVEKRYGGRAVLSGVSFQIARGERIALIGENGSGKTTLLRTILGELPPLSGAVELGYHVTPGYFAQVQEFAGERTVLESVLGRRDQTVAEARSLLGRFLFSGEEVFKRVGELSGGELSRLALARLAQTEGNLLLLDEPGSHLDIPSQEVLQEALEGYEGTVILVSHDHYLVDRLATQVWEIEGGALRVYEGGYSYYRRRRAEERRLEPRSQRQRPPRRKERSQPRPGQEDHAAELLERAAEMEEELSRLERELLEASYAGDPQRIAELHARYKERKRELEELLAGWDLLP